MLRPPSLSCAVYFPVTSLTAFLAICVTLFWWDGNDISFLFMDYRAWWGEPWRLVTSCLPHVDFVHLASNLFWLWVFGTVVEKRLGALRTAAFFLLFETGAAAAEYALFDGGVGLSGVGYGLFGMLWVLSRRDKRFAGSMDGQTVTLFLVWLVLCILLSMLRLWQIGNVAHVAGLVLGLFAGYSLSAHAPRQRFIGWGSIALTMMFIMLASYVARPYVNLSPTAGTDIAYHGALKLEAGQPEVALPLLQEAVKLKPREPDWWCNLGIAYQQLHRYPEALEAYQRSLKLNPKADVVRTVIVDLKGYLARQSLNRGDNEGAARLFREALALNDQEASCWHGLGMALQSLGDKTAATDAFQRAVDLESSVPR